MPDPVAEQIHNLTHAVGVCIMTWAMVERGLTVLYCECIDSGVGSKNFMLNASTFESVISIDARLDMVGATLKWKSGLFFVAHVPAPDYIGEWKSLRNQIRDKYVKRNELAHSDIIQRGQEDGSTLVRLAPFPTVSNVMYKTLLSLDQLRERNTLFEKLSADIGNFRDRIRTIPTLPPISP